MKKFIFKFIVNSINETEQAVTIKAKGIWEAISIFHQNNKVLLVIGIEEI